MKTVFVEGDEDRIKMAFEFVELMQEQRKRTASSPARPASVVDLSGYRKEQPKQL